MVVVKSLCNDATQTKCSMIQNRKIDYITLYLFNDIAA